MTRVSSHRGHCRLPLLPHTPSSTCSSLSTTPRVCFFLLPSLCMPYYLNTGSTSSSTPDTHPGLQTRSLGATLDPPSPTPTLSTLIDIFSNKSPMEPLVSITCATPGPLGFHESFPQPPSSCPPFIHPWSLWSALYTYTGVLPGSTPDGAPFPHSLLI